MSVKPLTPGEGTQGQCGAHSDTGTAKQGEAWESCLRAEVTDHACDGGSWGRGRGIPSVHGCW